MAAPAVESFDYVVIGGGSGTQRASAARTSEALLRD